MKTTNMTLKELRESQPQNWTCHDVDILTGFTNNTCQRMESGEIGDIGEYYLDKMARLYGISRQTIQTAYKQSKEKKMDFFDLVRVKFDIEVVFADDKRGASIVPVFLDSVLSDKCSPEVRDAFDRAIHTVIMEKSKQCNAIED